VCYLLDDESPVQAGPRNVTRAASDVDRATWLRCSARMPPGRLDRGAVGDAGPAGTPLANVVRDEDVDRSPVALPAVLLALGRDAVRDEVKVGQGAG
jgi:hypothetical protein